jgi:hypothetical protein
MQHYTLQDVRRDGKPFVLETETGRLTGDSAAVLVQVANAEEQGKQRPAFFLEAWKEAVQLAGARFFDIRSASVEAATDKNELAPDLAAITGAIGVLSGGEKRFLLAIYQFYNDHDIYEFCQERDIKVPSLSDLPLLDEKQRIVIAQLLHSYDGW